MTSSNGDFDSKLLKRLESFDLTTEEGDQALVGDEDVKAGVDECLRSCFGKIFTNRETPLKFLRPAIVKAWHTEKLKVIRIGQNLFQIFFGSVEEATKVATQRPWCIDN